MIRISQDIIDAFRKSDECDAARWRAVTERMFQRENERWTSAPALKWRAVLSMKGAAQE